MQTPLSSSEQRLLLDAIRREVSPDIRNKLEAWQGTVVEIGTGADLGKVRLARADEPTTAGELLRNFYPVIGSTPVLGSGVWALSWYGGGLVITGGTSGASGVQSIETLSGVVDVAGTGGIGVSAGSGTLTIDGSGVTGGGGGGPSATLDNISNPDGNIDIAGAGGILITADDTTNTITVDGSGVAGGGGATQLGAFSAYTSVSTQSILNTTTTVIDFNVKDFDPDGWFDLTTNRYTPQQEGYYLLGGNVRTSTGVDQKLAGVLLRRNGIDYMWLAESHMSHVAASVPSGFCVVYADGVDDYFELAVWQNTGTTLTVGGGASRTHFMGGYLGGGAGGGVQSIETLTGVVDVAGTGGIGISAAGGTLTIDGSGVAGGGGASSDLVMVTNATGATIAYGSAVKIVGMVGGVPSVALAEADDVNSIPAFGMVQTVGGLLNNASDYVLRKGLLGSRNTASYSAGQPVWLSSNAGLIRTTDPGPGFMGQVLGHVAEVNASTGSIYVDVDSNFLPKTRWATEIALADTTSSATPGTFVSIPDFNMGVTSLKTYVFRGTILYTVASTANAMELSYLTGAVALGGARTQVPLTVSTETVSYFSAQGGAAIGATSALSGTGINIARFEGAFNYSSNTSFDLQFTSDVASGVVVKAGSTLEWTVL